MDKLLLLTAFMATWALVNSGESQHITITIINNSGTNLGIENAGLRFGKWTHDVSKCNEKNSPNLAPIRIGVTYVVASCGRWGSPSGTEGKFDITDYDGLVTFAEVKWNIPFSGDDSFSLKDVELKGVKCYLQAALNIRSQKIFCHDF